MSTPTFPVVARASRWDQIAPGRPLTVPSVRRARGRRAVPAVVLLSDAVAVAVAVLLAAWVLPAAGLQRSPWGRSGFALLAGTAVLAVLAVRGAYSGARRHPAPRVADDLAPLVVGLALAGLCLLAVDALMPAGGRYPAGDVVLVLVACLGLFPLCRSLGLRAASAFPANVSRVVVVGSDEVAQGLVERLSRSRLVEVVGTVDDEPADGRPVLGSVEDLPRICDDRGIDRVVIAFSRRHPARSAQILLGLPGGVDVDVVARYYELMGWESRLSDVTGLSLVSVGRPAGFGSAAAKRVLDLVVAVTALVVLGPLFAAVAVAVRLSPGGPVLFRQTRVGRDGRPFAIVKFRTMRPAPASTGPRSPLEFVADPALVTTVGRFLRRSGLDELPQLVNVVRGQMSLVGPRPFVPEECTGLPDWASRRLAVRPGMTGMWQVCGQHERSFEELCRLDVQYATSWTLRSDLRILARTPGRLLQGSAPGR